LAAGAAAVPAISSVAGAQGYPTRPIRLVVPFPPGGAFDTIGRPWAEQMKSRLGMVVVENIGGGGGSVGAAQASRARADGYTLLLGGATTHITEALLKNRPQFDPVKDLEPISGIAITAFALAVHPSVPANDLNELIAYAKANPGKLSYGSAGTGSLNHLTAEAFKLRVGLPDLIHVPYRGAGPAISDHKHRRNGEEIGVSPDELKAARLRPSRKSWASRITTADCPYSDREPQFPREGFPS